jgi:hypothetical protein
MTPTLFEAGAFNVASTTELAVLDFAIAVGADQYRFQSMGHTHPTLLAAAAVRAIDPVLPPLRTV